MSVPKYLQNFSKIEAAPQRLSEVQRVFHFGSFTLSESQRLLTCEDNPVDLRAKDFDVLLVLLKNRSKLVTKAQLLDEVWPNSFVEEANLVVHIAELRRVLRRHSANRYIETVPKYGYRFVDDEVSTRDETTAPTSRRPMISLVQHDDKSRQRSNPERTPKALLTLEGGLRIEAWEGPYGARVTLAVPHKLNEQSFSQSSPSARSELDAVLVTAYEKDGTLYVTVDLDPDLG